MNAEIIEDIKINNFIFDSLYKIKAAIIIKIAPNMPKNANNPKNIIPKKDVIERELSYKKKRYDWLFLSTMFQNILEHVFSFY
ncbi:MAG: hypothetical protein HPY79_09685 [Bacteroidales bacterium]|nr:hypothetical protein [Bacteroidales bacterium]